AKNPKRYWQTISELSMEEPGKPSGGQRTYALARTGDLKRIAFTNYLFDAAGFGWIEVTDDSVDNFEAHIVRSLDLTLGSLFDTLDVNSATAVLFLPANAFKAAIGEHPAY